MEALDFLRHPGALEIPFALQVSFFLGTGRPLA